MNIVRAILEKNDVHEIKNDLKTFYAHVAKYHSVPEAQSSSWVASIYNVYKELKDLSVSAKNDWRDFSEKDYIWSWTRGLKIARDENPGKLYLIMLIIILIL